MSHESICAAATALETAGIAQRTRTADSSADTSGFLGWNPNAHAERTGDAGDRPPQDTNSVRVEAKPRRPVTLGVSIRRSRYSAVGNGRPCQRAKEVHPFPRNSTS
eukprot:6813431-Pyramimonas_sp.AAC.1